METGKKGIEGKIKTNRLKFVYYHILLHHDNSTHKKLLLHCKENQYPLNNFITNSFT